MRQFAAVLLTSISSHAALATTGTSQPYTPCANVTMVNQTSLTALPQSSQQAIRKATLSSVEAIVNDKGMGMEGTNVQTVPLSAVRVTGSRQASALYVVSWGDRSFGVNQPIWIVELTPKGAKNLVRLRRDQSPGYFLGGFGFETLSPKAEVYPGIMVASKGFRDGGGAEAEDVCVGKRGEYYEKIACPIICHDILNRR